MLDNYVLDDSNLGTMICFHKRYELGHKTDLIAEQFRGWEGLKTYLEKEKEAVIILPLYLLDHSGLWINTSGFSCAWDSGQVGFIYTTKEKIQEFMGIKKITKSVLKKVKTMLIDEVKTYSEILEGNVWYYRVEKKKVCKCCNVATYEDIESCNGFIGDIDKNGIKDIMKPKYFKIIDDRNEVKKW